MVWIVTGVVLGVCALAALGFCGLKVWHGVRGLMKEIGRATTVVNEAAAPVKTEVAKIQSVLPSRDESLPAVR